MQVLLHVLPAPQIAPDIPGPATTGQMAGKAPSIVRAVTRLTRPIKATDAGAEERWIVNEEAGRFELGQFRDKVQKADGMYLEDIGFEGFDCPLKFLQALAPWPSFGDVKQWEGGC